MNVFRFVFAFLLAAISGFAVSGQSGISAQNGLKQDLVGKSIAVKIDMPATKLGVNITSGKSAAFDRRKYDRRVAAYGVAIPNGQAVIITGVEVKGDQIVLQLAGGGAPDLDLEKTIGAEPGQREQSSFEKQTRNLLSSPSATTNADVLRSAFIYESHKRQQDDIAYRGEYLVRRNAAIENDRKQRATMGSRFVIKLKSVDLAAITPEMVKNILADYLDFSAMK